MKLAIYIQDLSGGGVERVMLDLIRAFQRSGHEVVLLLHTRQGELLAELTSDIKVISFNNRHVSQDLPQMIRYIRINKPDFLISSLDHQNVVAMLAKALAFGPTKVIICQHNALSKEASLMTSWKYRVIPQLYSWLSPYFAAGFVAVSKGVADDITKASGVQRAAITVIYNPITGPDFTARAAEPATHPWFSDNGPPVFINAGRLVAQKDHATLLRAFAMHLAVSPARLMILGTGPLEAELRQLATELGIMDAVAFVGFVKNPLPYMREATAFLLTSRYEGFGNVVVEAMGAGTPVVAFGHSFGPSEILGGGRFGRLVPPGDIEAFAAAISPRLRDEFPSEMLRERAGHFTAERSANSYLALMNKIGTRKGCMRSFDQNKQNLRVLEHVVPIVELTGESVA